MRGFGAPTGYRRRKEAMLAARALLDSRATSSRRGRVAGGDGAATARSSGGGNGGWFSSIWLSGWQEERRRAREQSRHEGYVRCQMAAEVEAMEELASLLRRRGKFWEQKNELLAKAYAPLETWDRIPVGALPQVASWLQRKLVQSLPTAVSGRSPRKLPKATKALVGVWHATGRESETGLGTRTP